MVFLVIGHLWRLQLHLRVRSRGLKQPFLGYFDVLPRSILHYRFLQRSDIRVVIRWINLGTRSRTGGGLVFASRRRARREKRRRREISLLASDVPWSPRRCRHRTHCTGEQMPQGGFGGQEVKREQKRGGETENEEWKKRTDLSFFVLPFARCRLIERPLTLHTYI